MLVLQLLVVATTFVAGYEQAVKHHTSSPAARLMAYPNGHLVLMKV